MSVINTNITSMIGQSNLSKSQSALTTSMERLSSGLRINSAKDDAAGQAIANRMSAQITGLAQAQRNANDGISVAQTAEGALNQINDNVQRIRELTVQSQNGTNSQEDLNSIQAEINQRVSEIDRISEQTDFNDTKVLQKDGVLTIQVGANDGESIDINLKEINSTTLGLASFNVNGAQGTPVIQDGSTTQAMKDAYGETTQVNTSTVTEVNGDFATKLGVATATVAANAYVDDEGNWFAQIDITAADETESNILKSQGIDIASGDTETFYIAIDPADADLSTATTAAFDIDVGNFNVSNLNSNRTANPMDELDSALKDIDSLRSDLGAIQNRFESAITNLNTNETNLSSARSRIEDADYATEVANMTRAQILQQAGTSVLAQANQIPQNVLSLLG